MIEGACHCGRVRWRFDGMPAGATACNCTICRRIAAIWAYGWEGAGITVTAAPEDLGGYVRADDPEAGLAIHFCRHCGNVTHWRGLAPHPDGRTRIAVNLRLAEPALVAGISVDRFDGFGSWKDKPADGRCVSDYWH